MDFIPAKVMAILDDLVAHRPVPTATDAQSTGDRTKRRVLDAAFALIASEKIGDFTMRNLAASLDMQVGNLTYHFPAKAGLIECLVRDQLASYAQGTLEILKTLQPDARVALYSFITFLVNDLRKDDIAFFPQLWAISLHDPQVSALMDELYALECQVFAAMIGAVRPAWPRANCASLALHIVAAIEGLTLFIGRNKANDGIFSAPETEIIQLLDLALDRSAAAMG
jgi:AcrR family transcriptional regulator